MGAFRRQESLLDEKRDDPCAEEFLQRRAAHVGHHMEKPAVHEEPVGGQCVEVRVEVEVFAEGMNGHDDACRALGQAERGALKLGQAPVGDAAEFLDKPAMKPEIRAEHLGDREREMPVRHGRKDGLGQQRAEELHLLLVARRAEPPTLARERQQILTTPPSLGGTALRATSGCLSHRAPAQFGSWAQWSQRTRAKPLVKSPQPMNFSTTSGMTGRRNP